MWGDREIADAGPVGQGEWDRRFLSALAALRVEDVRTGVRPEGVALERPGDGGGEFLRPVVVEQPEQPGGVAAE